MGYVESAAKEQTDEGELEAHPGLAQPGYTRRAPVMTGAHPRRQRGRRIAVVEHDVRAVRQARNEAEGREYGFLGQIGTTPSQVKKVHADGSKPAAAKPSAKVSRSKPMERTSAPPAAGCQPRRGAGASRPAGLDDRPRKRASDPVVSSPAPSTTSWGTPRSTAAASASSAKRVLTAMKIRIPRPDGRRSASRATASAYSPRMRRASGSAKMRPCSNT